MAEDEDGQWEQGWERYKDYETSRRIPQKDTASSPREETYDDFFQSPSLIYCFVILTGLLSFQVFCFHTHLFPFDLLGGPGRRLKFLAEHHMSMMQIGYFVAIGIHFAEATLCYFKCRSINISPTATKKWILQTFIFGFCSLRLLDAHVKEKKEK